MKTDLTGRTFGRLIVLSRAPKTFFKVKQWLCRCACGAHTVVPTEKLSSGNTRSCGCLRRDAAGKRSTTHGATKRGKRTGAFKSYMHAKMRCTNPRVKGYQNYGGRGVEFRFDSFEQFFAELGHRPLGTTLDRIDNDGHYEPGNVRWATAIEQAQNKTPRSPSGPRGARRCGDYATWTGRSEAWYASGTA